MDTSLAGSVKTREAYIFGYHSFCVVTEGKQAYSSPKGKGRISDVKTGAPVECLARNLAKQGKENMKRQNGRRMGIPQFSVPKTYIQGIPICPQVWTLAEEGRWAWRLQSCQDHSGVQGTERFTLPSAGGNPEDGNKSHQESPMRSGVSQRGTSEPSRN